MKMTEEGMYIKFKKPVVLKAGVNYFIGVDGTVKEVIRWEGNFPVFG